jgi:hypothetical protein
MANNQQTGGNSMAALLGNMQNKTQRPGAQPAWGGGLQPPMQGGWSAGPQQAMGAAGGQAPDLLGTMGPYKGPMQQPAPPGGPGYPQMTPPQMQNMAGLLSAQQQKPRLPGGLGPMQAMQRPMIGQRGMNRRPFGAPGLGAGGDKAQQIAQLPGGPGR